MKLVCLAFIGCNASIVHAAGMTNHPFVSYLAWEYTNISSTSPSFAAKVMNALASHQNVVSAASSIPDYFYMPAAVMGVEEKDVNAYRDASEKAHWPPFHSAYATYIRNRPDFKDAVWSDETNKEVAFLLGMASHSLVDIQWEGLQDSGNYKDVGVTVSYWNMLKRGRGMTSFLSAQNHGDAGYGNHNEMPTNLAADLGLPSIGLNNPITWGLDSTDRNYLTLPQARHDALTFLNFCAFFPATRSHTFQHIPVAHLSLIHI